jgi:hypothetical protein
LFDCRLHCSKRAGQVRIGVEHDTVDADRQCRHNGTLDHLMGRFFEQHAILEGAGLVLVTVYDQVFVRFQRFGGDKSLAPCRKPLPPRPRRSACFTSASTAAGF